MTNARLLSIKRSNNLKTFFLMTTFLVVVVFLGLLLSLSTGKTSYLYTAIFLSLTLNIISYFFSDKIALSVAGAELADENKYQELYQVVSALSKKNKMPKPKIYVIQEAGPNAFATGRDEKHSSVAVTTGLLATLNKSELEGVIAHELSHIKNKDILIMTSTVVMAGVISMLANFAIRRSFASDKESNALAILIGVVASIILPIAASLIQLAISRKREFIADASSGLLTGYPEGLASALQKIGAYTQPLTRASSSTAHLYISCPFGSEERQTFFQKLFMTHPPIEERIKALLNNVQ